MNSKYLMRSFFLNFLILCTSTSHVCAYVQASTDSKELKSEKDSPELINGEFKVKEPGLPGLLFHCTLEGRPVPLGEKRKFLLRIKNPAETDLHFDQVKVTCDCLDVKCEQKSVKPSEWLELIASYQAPTKARSVKYNFSLSFQLKGAPIGLVTVNGELQNTLVILSDGLYESNGPVSKWEIEVLTSPPIDNRRLEVELDKSLGSIASEIIEKDSKAFVRLEVAETALGVSGFSGRMKVIDSKLGLSDTCFLTFVKTPFVRVSPLFARFVDVKDRPGFYSTTFFAQAQHVKQPNDDSKEAVKNRLLNVDIKSNDYELEVKKTEINESIWRFDVFVNRSENKKGAEIKSEEFKIVWTLDSTHGKLSLESDCYFLEKLK